MGLEQQVEEDLDHLLELCISHNNLQVMKRTLEKINTTYKNYDHYFKILEDLTHKEYLRQQNEE